jgi:predicted permease
MAAGTVAFSVVDAVALRPLPYGTPDRLVGISSPGMRPGTLIPITPQDYYSLVDGARAFEGLAASRPDGSLRLTLADGVETMKSIRITANLFDVLGVRPEAGRWFGPEDERPGAAPAVILSHDVWVHRFGADPAVIGRYLRFADRTREVIGVVPRGVWFPITAAPPDVYVPYVPTPADRIYGPGRTFVMTVVGRMRLGVAVAQARADVVRVFTSAVVVLPLHDQAVGSAKGWLLLVLVAVTFILLIACVNVASLLLARAVARTPEFATREALGASRRRLAGGLMIEGVMLATASAAAALLMSPWGVGIVKASLPAGLLTRTTTIAIDARVLVVSAAAALLCGIAFGSAPAWMTLRADLFGLMKGSGSVLGDRRAGRWLGALSIAEVVFVSVLLVTTTLAVSTFVVITTMDLGFDRHNLSAIWYERSLADLPIDKRDEAAAAVRRDILERARAVPGVAGAAIEVNGGLPLEQSSVRYGLDIPGYGEVRGDDMLETRMVTPDYFRVMGMQLVRGRTFAASDRAGAPRVMLINDVAARRFFAGRDPVGQVVTFRGPTTIVGVLRGVHVDGPEAATRPEMYTLADQEPARYQAIQGASSGVLVVRASQNAPAVVAAVREAIRPALGGAEPQQPQWVEQFFSDLTTLRRFNAGLMTALGAVALVLGGMGIYATMAFLVACQVRAIGLRLALGASPAEIVRLVLWAAGRRVAVGAALGLAGAWATSSAFRALAFGVRVTEPSVYIVVAGLLASAGVLAALAPALRAARLDPLEALRHE